MVAGLVNPILLPPGHNAGDLVESYKWSIIKKIPGELEVKAHLPERLLNPREQLFGGFHGVYVDLMSIYAARTLLTDTQSFKWSTTINMRIDYFAPVKGESFLLNSEVINDGKSTCLVATTFKSLKGVKLVYAIATLKKSN